MIKLSGVILGLAERGGLDKAARLGCQGTMSHVHAKVS
jgi:hypothetical protein